MLIDKVKVRDSRAFPKRFTAFSWTGIRTSWSFLFGRCRMSINQVIPVHRTPTGFSQGSYFF